MRTIKIYVEVPENWVEAQRAEDLGAFLRSTKEMIVNKAIDKLIDKIVVNTKLPKVKITVQEVKDRMLDILAKKALEKEK